MGNLENRIKKQQELWNRRATKEGPKTVMCSDFTPDLVIAADSAQKEVIKKMYSGKPKKTLGLEIGSGMGRLSSFFLDYVDSLIAMDLSRKMLDRMGVNTKIYRMIADSQNIPLTSGIIDSIFITNILGHINHDSTVVQTAVEINRITSPNSLLLIDEMTGTEGELVAGHYLIRSPERIGSLFVQWKQIEKVNYDFASQPHVATLYTKKQ
jgi:SAM-dependent methyltransferase